MADEPTVNQPLPPGTVLVNKEALDKLIKRQEDQEQQITLLTEAADKGRMDLIQRRHQKPLGRVVHVHKFQGKYVESTAMKVNEAYHDSLGAYIEKQELEVKFFDDAKAIVVPYRQYGIQHEKIPAEVVSSTTNSEGRTMLVVKIKGEETTLTVDVRFVN